MKKVLVVACAISLVALTLPAGETLAPGAGVPMADVKMLNVDGTKVSIADAMGAKGTLVLFTCNACPWVKAWEERIAALGNEYSARGVGVIAINPNDPTGNEEDGYDVMQARAEQYGLKFAYVVDATSDVARAFGATRTPEAFLFDAGGKLVYHGTIDNNAKDAAKADQQYLRDALEAVASGAQVPLAQTKALGCTIKFRAES